MRKKAGAWFTLMDYFNLLLLPLLVLVVVFMLIWAGIFVAWWMLMSTLNRLFGNQPLCFPQGFRATDDRH